MDISVLLSPQSSSSSSWTRTCPRRPFKNATVSREGDDKSIRMRIVVRESISSYTHVLRASCSKGSGQGRTGMFLATTCGEQCSSLGQKLISLIIESIHVPLLFPQLGGIMVEPENFLYFPRDLTHHTVSWVSEFARRAYRIISDKTLFGIQLLLGVERSRQDSPNIHMSST